MLSSDASLFGFCCNVIRSFFVQTDFPYSTTALMQLVRALCGTPDKRPSGFDLSQQL